MTKDYVFAFVSALADVDAKEKQIKALQKACMDIDLSLPEAKVFNGVLDALAQIKLAYREWQNPILIGAIKDITPPSGYDPLAWREAIRTAIHDGGIRAIMVDKDEYNELWQSVTGEKIATIHEYERCREKVFATVAGLVNHFRSHAATGQIIGRPPFGYILNEQRSMIPDPEWVPVIKDIFKEFDANHSLGEILASLKAKHPDDQRLACWDCTRIRRVLIKEQLFRQGEWINALGGALTDPEFVIAPASERSRSYLEYRRALSPVRPGSAPFKTKPKAKPKAKAKARTKTKPGAKSPEPKEIP